MDGKQLQDFIGHMASLDADTLKKGKENEEEAYNVIDETHKPLFHFILTLDRPDKSGVTDIMGGVTKRTTDGKIAVYYRYRYQDGHKEWHVISKKESKGSNWNNITPEELPTLKMSLVKSAELTAELGEPKGTVSFKDFTGNESTEEVLKYFMDSQKFFGAKIDKTTGEKTLFNIDD